MKTPSSRNSQMRVLVAVQRCEQRIILEKALSLMGYFRVCPVSTFEELTRLSHFSPNLYDRFDVLIVNADVVSAAGLDAADFCLNCSRFKHVLIQDSVHAGKRPSTLSAKANHHVRMVNAIDYEALESFLSLVDKHFNGSRVSALSVSAA